MSYGTPSAAIRYPYLTLKKRIIKTKVKDTPFAAIIGSLCRKKPYIIHRNKPTPMKINIKREMSLVSFSFHDFITWGTNDVVVNTAAANPISVIQSNCILYIIIIRRPNWPPYLHFLDLPEPLPETNQVL